MDLFDIHKNKSVFLLGGHPSLKEENLDHFKRPGIVTMAMNNTATVVRPNYWVCADKPLCYSKSVIQDPGITKFARLTYTNHMIDNVMWKDQPLTYFYGLDPKIKHEEVLERHRQLAWWQNVFIIGIQICYHLGFRKIYTVGCSFNIDKNAQYAYQSNLTDDQIDYNQRTYQMIIDQISRSIPHFNEKGLQIISCTPNSKLASLFPSLSFEEAIKETLKEYPIHNTLTSKHCTMLKKATQ